VRSCSGPLPSDAFGAQDRVKVRAVPRYAASPSIRGQKKAATRDDRERRRLLGMNGFVCESFGVQIPFAPSNGPSFWAVYRGAPCLDDLEPTIRLEHEITPPPQGDCRFSPSGHPPSTELRACLDTPPVPRYAAKRRPQLRMIGKEGGCLYIGASGSTLISESVPRSPRVGPIFSGAVSRGRLTAGDCAGDTHPNPSSSLPCATLQRTR
jgi:hypothetical protein